jgi:hypothetical protein
MDRKRFKLIKVKYKNITEGMILDILMYKSSCLEKQRLATRSVKNKMNLTKGKNSFLTISFILNTV